MKHKTILGIIMEKSMQKEVLFRVLSNSLFYGIIYLREYFEGDGAKDGVGWHNCRVGAHLLLRLRLHWD